MAGRLMHAEGEELALFSEALTKDVERRYGTRYR